MSLPIVKTAVFTVKNREFKKPLELRNMIVGEHKLIQQAVDLGTEDDLRLNLGRIVESCSNGQVVQATTANYIMEYLFMQIYMNSVESVISSNYKCTNTLKDADGKSKIDDETGDEVICNTGFIVNIPVKDMKIMYPDNYEESKIVNVSDNVKIYLKNLSYSQSAEIDELINKTRSIFEALPDNLLVDSDQYRAADAEIKIIKNEMEQKFMFYSIDKVVETKADGTDAIEKLEALDYIQVAEWIDSLPSTVIKDIEAFMKEFPIIGLDLKVRCPNPECKYEQQIKLRGLSDFFV